MDNLSDISLDVAYKMCWEKRSEGHMYDSLSGHDFLVGLQNK